MSDRKDGPFDSRRRNFLLGGSALSVLAAGLAAALVRLGSLLNWLVQGRGRVLSPMEFNQP